MTKKVMERKSKLKTPRYAFLIAMNIPCKRHIFCRSREMRSGSDAKDGCLALNPVEDASIVNGHILLRDDLDDLLGHHAAGEGAKVV